MLNISTISWKLSTTGKLLHHFVRSSPSWKYKKILHQPYTLSFSDDSSKNNNDNINYSEFTSLNQSVVSSNNYRHLKHKNDEKLSTRKNKRSESHLDKLFNGLSIDVKCHNKKHFRQQKFVKTNGDSTEFYTGRELYLREALSSAENNPRIMPKIDKLHLEPLRHYRLAKRKRDLIKGVPHNIYFQAVSNGAPGSGNALFLYTDANRFLFNCGEGTQRLALEYCGHGTLSYLTDIFVTRKSWDNLGGLPGMFLSIRSTGAPDVTVHGPIGVNELHDITKTFIVLHDFDVIFETDSHNIFEDQAVTIKSVPLIPFDLPGGEVTVVKPKIPKHTLWLPDVIIGQTSTGEYLTNAVNETNPYQKSKFEKPIDQTVVAYVVNCKPKAGKLQIDKCVALGVTPGPLLGELKAGRDVMLDNGEVVRSVDVLDDESPPMSYIIVECPSHHYLHSLTNNMELAADSDILKDKLQAIFHFSPSHVVSTPEYKSWMNSFPTGIQHIFLNDSTHAYGGHAIQGFNFRMNDINPNIFPLVSTHSTLGTSPEDKNPEESINESLRECYNGIYGRTIHAKLAQKLNVRPNANILDDSSRWYPTPFGKQTNDEEILNLPEASQEVICDTRKLLSAMKLKDSLSSSDTQYEYPKVTFLGTGSSVPSKYRNVSAILLEFLPAKYIILDCGEGTVLQLHRLYGRDKAKSILKGLCAVYVSHMHADHQAGLIQIVKEREKAFEEQKEKVAKLYLIAPSRISVFLCFYHAKFEDILTDLCLIRNEHLLPFIPPDPNSPRYSEFTPVTPGAEICESNPYSNQAINTKDTEVTTQKIYPFILKPLLEAIGLKSIKTCRALHCPGAFSVSFIFHYEEDDRKFKLVYTGDTRPTEQLIQLASNADLLIHEATMEHHMLEDAKIKKHSTFIEAVEDARQAKAKFTILTHFSQRYAKFPIFDEFDEEENVSCAWDFMTVSPKDFRYIKPVYQAINARFPEDFSQMLARKEEFEGKKDEKNNPGTKILRDLGLEDENDKTSYKTKNRAKKRKVI